MLDKHSRRLPAGDRALYEAALDGFDPAALDGDTLIHYDLHGENILLTADGGAQVIDWSFAVRAAAWVDAALFVPRLIESGHRPGHVGHLLAELPAWRSAPREAVRGLAALWTLFRIYKATFGPAENREFRARAADAGRAWTRHCITA